MGDLKKQISLTADASGVETGVGKAKRSLADLGVTAVTEGKKASEGLKPVGEAAQQSSAKLEAATKNMIGSIQRATAAAEAGSKSGSAFFQSLAGQRGIDVDALKPYLAQLDAAVAKQKLAQETMNATAPALQRVGVSAAQTAAALRGVPAQFTDIVTSLQGGQAPLTVFLQQGGQLKDMFGGIGPAAQALGGYIASLITPFTLSAVAVAALALAMSQGSQESKEYAKALILSGNAAGLTTDQLKGMAAQVSKIIGTQGEAAEVLAKVVSSGKFAGNSITEVSTAIVAMNQVLGTSVDDALATFTKLAEEPAKASAKLNSSMHYLNDTTYERIRALEEQGHKEEAAALAVSTAATITTDRLRAVQQQVGFLTRFWQGLSKDAKDAWDAMQGLGRQKTTGEMLADAQQNLAALAARGPIGGPVTGRSDFADAMKNATVSIGELSRKALREQENAYAEGQRAQGRAEKIDATQRLADQKKATRDRAAQRKDELDQLQRDAKLVGMAKADYDERVAAINEKYKDPKGAAPKAYQDDAATRFIEQLKQTEASLRTQLDGESKLTAEQKKQVEFQQLIADLKGKKILTADQQSLLAGADRIKAQLEINTALSDQVKYEEKILEIVNKSKTAAAEFARQIEAVNISMAAGQESRNEQYDRELGAFGLGDRAMKEIQDQRAIRGEYQRYLTQITKQAADKDELGSDAYAASVANIKKSLDDALAAQSTYYAKEKAMREDWKNGATKTLANYVDYTNDIASATGQTIAGAFKGGEDALTQFVTKGKGDFKSLADSILADLARIAIQQTITGPLAKGLLDALGGGNSLDGLLRSNNAFGTGGGGGGTNWTSLLTTIGSFFGGMFADGGSPPVGKVSLVGEKGPELFVPKGAGTIIPNGAFGGGQPIVVNQNFTVGDVATVSMVRQAVAGSEKRIASTVARSQRYGGTLA